MELTSLREGQFPIFKANAKNYLDFIKKRGKMNIFFNNLLKYGIPELWGMHR